MPLALRLFTKIFSLKRYFSISPVQPSSIFDENLSEMYCQIIFVSGRFFHCLVAFTAVLTSSTKKSLLTVVPLASAIFINILKKRKKSDKTFCEKNQKDLCRCKGNVGSMLNNHRENA